MLSTSQLASYPIARTVLCLALATVACNDCHNPNENGGVGGGGALLWKYPLADVGSGWTGLPVIVGSTVYVETTNTVLAIDLSTGTKRWQTVVKSNPSPAAANIVAAGGALYLAEAVDVVSLDAVSGTVRWRFTPDAQAAAAQSAVDDHALYIGTRSHKVYALDPSSGQPLWTTDIGTDWPYLGVVMGLSVSGDTVYAGAVKRLTAAGDSSVGIIAGLDRNSGAILFLYQAPQSVAASSVTSAPVVNGRMLLASDLGGAFYAIDRFTLQELWRVRTQSGFFGPFARPALVNGRVYVGTNDTYVYATDAVTGNLVWKTTTNASIHESAVCGQRIFANNLAIFVLDVSTGQVLRTLFDDDPNEIPSSGFAVASDRVVFSGVHGAYALPCS
jgi:outer membrane protein assembly factor BamB